jgi:cardiolipin synthase A/B
VKLIIEPEDGADPILAALKRAKKSIEIAIFRFDRSDIEKALKAAVADGVKVAALVADVNRGGEKNLRQLETRFLEAGITVARTAGDLVRYHDKMIIIDRRTLLVLSFNFTHMDIDHSRGFGIVTKNAVLVQEAVQLFDADCARHLYTAGPDTFVVSPANSRKVLRNFLKRARTQLLIYDPQVSDKEMVRILQERAKSGVEIRIIGKIGGRSTIPVQRLTRMRLHTRTIIRDGRQAFVGSQSLRSVELDSRRELGLIVRESKVVKKLIATFESDWSTTAGVDDQEKSKDQQSPAAHKEDAEKVLASIVQELHPITDAVREAVKKVAAQNGAKILQDKMVKSTVKKVVKKAVKQAVKEAARDSRKAKS